ncbi:Conserved oligomeric Golgi complex subunit 2 [Pleurostoma richardsiae]|uniref:Conserved oligomeric Golgi complex subunit 2 n=1 Tax=Pleurostoma richardsiae TaxID=41990 RepID=A0AA38RKU5_9PEZI|nr:Conserved oligomeric Golgi complex subunit 2 [Pleurostoma richardsiae]
MANGLGLTVNIPPPTPRSPFIFSSDSSPSLSDSDGPLPFPTALPRNDFLAPSFHAPTYLSSLFPSATDDDATSTDDPDNSTSQLHELRHQTLEDLRAELRERSAAISAELLELVNANYASFLSLGDGLKGGGDRVEDLRVALLGFRRQVGEVKGRIGRRREDVARASGELRGVRAEVETGRSMLELDERVAMLERSLAVRSMPGGKHNHDDADDSEEEDEDEEEEAEDFVGSSPAKLAGLASDYKTAEELADALGRDLPYVKKMEERMLRCRNTMLLDLSTATKEARRAGERGQDRVLRYLAIYRLLGAHTEGVRALKEQ